MTFILKVPIITEHYLTYHGRVDMTILISFLLTYPPLLSCRRGPAERTPPVEQIPRCGSGPEHSRGSHTGELRCAAGWAESDRGLLCVAIDSFKEVWQQTLEEQVHP